MKFKIGDKVRCHKKDYIDSEVVLGLSGVICDIDSSLVQPYKIQFYTPRFGLFMWWILEESIELVAQKTAEELEKERIDRICKKITYLEDKYERRMKYKKDQKCQDSLNMNPAQNVGAETTLQDTRMGLGGVLGAGLRRCRDEALAAFQERISTMYYLNQHPF